MSQPTSVLQTVCRSCRKSILNSATTRQQSRTFAVSASRSKVLPAFNESSHQELNDILARWRREVFTPAVLSRTHKNLIYKKSRQYILLNDPGVTVTLSDGEEVKLDPMDMTGRPNKRHTLRDLARILGNDGDKKLWDNLPKFLEGLVSSEEAVPQDFLERITRKANELGRQGTIRQCAVMVKRTGVSLSIRPVTRELFMGIHQRATEAGFKGEDFDAALEEATSLALLLEKEDHCGGKQPYDATWSQQKKERHIDMRKDPTVMGIMLELHAANALEKHNGTDATGVVTQDIQRLLNLLGISSGSADDKAASSAIEATWLDRLMTQNDSLSAKIVENLLPLSQAIRLTLKVSGLAGGQKSQETKLKMTLSTLLDRLDAHITQEVNKARSEAGGKSRRALRMFEQLK